MLTTCLITSLGKSGLIINESQGLHSEPTDSYNVHSKSGLSFELVKSNH